MRHRKTLCPGKDISPEMKKAGGRLHLPEKEGRPPGMHRHLLPRHRQPPSRDRQKRHIHGNGRPHSSMPLTSRNSRKSNTLSMSSQNPKKWKVFRHLDPKKYGVIVVKGYRKGLLLPDLEGVDTAEDQLRITKMKAGIERSETDVDIYRFTVDRYK
ncbi:MAG: AMMECR1 domain-containing protein [Desulfobacterales bacterium]|nr:AMMECR1 domain-containing protein [Desulfobacterales bacterium]